MTAEVKKRRFAEGTEVSSPTDLTIDESNNQSSLITTSTVVTDSDDVKWLFASPADATFTFVPGDVSTVNDTITEVAHGLADGDPIRFTNSLGYQLPDPLIAHITYFVINATLNDFQLSDDPGGSVKSFTNTGSGTHTANPGLSVTLPTSSDNPDREIGLKKVNATDAPCVLATESGEFIDDGSTRFIECLTEDTLAVVKSDGTGYETLSRPEYIEDSHVMEFSSLGGSGVTKPAITMSIKMIGRVVHISLPTTQVQTSSNWSTTGNVFTDVSSGTELPVKYRPATDKTQPIPRILDNAVTKTTPGRVVVTSSGTIQIISDCSGGGFSTGNNNPRGTDARIHITYDLD